MFLIIDCETTSFPYWNQSFDFRGQARIMQLGALLLDEQFREVCSLGCLLKPDNWPVVHQGAFDTHGLTEDICNQYGLPQKMVFEQFDYMAERADFVIAHGLRFDSFMFDVELQLLGMPTYAWTEFSICTMRATCDLYKTKNPSKRGPGPNLNELYEFCFGEKRIKSHEALADAKDTACCLGWLLQKRHLKLSEFKPAVLTEE